MAGVLSYGINTKVLKSLVLAHVHMQLDTF